MPAGNTLSAHLQPRRFVIELAWSNRLEALVEPLATRVDTAQRQAPLAPITIITPNRIVQSWLRVRLAEKLGIAAGLRFVQLVKFAAGLSASVDEEVTVLSADNLFLRFFVLLESPHLMERPEMAPITRWLARGSEQTTHARHRAELARRLATLFEEYSFSRDDMLQRWARGEDSDVEHPAQAWQKTLWRAAITSGDRRSVSLPQGARQALAAGASVPPQVFVFGVENVSASLAQFVYELGDRCDVFLYALNPCMEYWEDVESARLFGGGELASLRSRFDERANDRAIGARWTESEDPFSIREDDDTPPLRLWGRPGREFVRLVNTLTDCTFEQHFEVPGTETVLNAVQRDILLREPRREAIAPPASGDDNVGAGDPSVRVIACASVRAECELIADNIWTLVHADDGARFSDFCVMIPDGSLEEYVAQLESAFRSQPRIRHTIVDSPLHRSSRAVQAIEALLALPHTELTRRQMLGVLIPLAHSNGYDDEAAVWRRWVDETNTLFGRDANSVADTYLHRGNFHWEQALNRLILGSAMRPIESGEERWFDGSDTRMLPLEVHPEQRGTLARFVQAVRGILRLLAILETKRMSAAEWSSVVVSFCREQLRPDSDRERAALRRALEAIDRCGNDIHDHSRVPFVAAGELFARALRGIPGQRSPELDTGVLVGPLSSTHMIPARYVFVPGLGESEFPSADERNQMDVRSNRRRAGETTVQERDRYHFLIALLSARQRLTVSYVGRDPISGEASSESSVVEEFTHTLSRHLSPRGLQAIHVEATSSIRDESETTWRPHLARTQQAARLAASLRRSLGAGFRPETWQELRESAGPAARDALDAVWRREEPIVAAGDAAASTTEDSEGPGKRRDIRRISVDLRSLADFLCAPIQARAAQRMRGLRRVTREPEPWEPTSLRWSVRNALVRAAISEGGGNPERASIVYKRELRALEQRGAAPAQVFFDHDVDQARDYFELARQLAAEDNIDLGEVPVVFRFGRSYRYQHVDEHLDTLQVRSPDAPDVEISITGVTLPWMRRQQRCVVFDAMRTSGTRSYHEPELARAWVDSAALEAAGVITRATCDLLYDGSQRRRPGREQLTFCRESRPEFARCGSAAVWLANLALDLTREGGDERFLPIEAVFEYARGRRLESIATCVTTVLESDNRLAEARGVLHDAAAYPVPDAAEFEALLARRYEAILVGAYR